MTLILTMDRVIRHTVVHQSSTSMHITNFIEIGKKNFVDRRTDVPTEGRTFPPLMLLGQLGGVDLMRPSFNTVYLSLLTIFNMQ